MNVLTFLNFDGEEYGTIPSSVSKLPLISSNPPHTQLCQLLKNTLLQLNLGRRVRTMMSVGDLDNGVYYYPLYKDNP